MKLLILGRDGQVGTALTQVLAPLGAIAAYGRQGADFSHPADLEGVVKREQPDVIVNAAAYTAVDRAESEPELARLVNTEGPAVLARVAAETGAWMIHYSTDYVFDGSGTTAWAEDDPTGPLNVYGETKRAGEEAIAASGCKHLVFRTSWVHAPGGNNFIAKMLSLAQSRDELKVIDDQHGAPTSARLIAEVTARAIQQIANDRPIPSGLYHLVASGETTWNGYARFAIAEALARGVPLKLAPERVLAVPTSAFPTPARRPLNSRLSTLKLRDALGIDLPNWKTDAMGTLDTILPEKMT
ncbi:MAG: dTDP-4-dehydrorhamnose reductase [Devosia sp.]|uniref:dTDP-4-dehydrorhamnose reductase n=1 Tax=Devosia sp. TaxID=1871048 RepID=UPI001AC5E9E3|nr:dTDP-4-dehydrorhamnose reductase [Devosia sp.]MBN9316328.1 dTDP-4-dehydrorhamnose reductase [Devosia sp.]